MHRLDVLGPPGLTRPDGSPADLALGKPFAVLVFLALTDTAPTRKELARLFWPGAEPGNARQSVRQTLSILRRALDPDLFESDDPVRLTPGAIETDVDRLGEALAEDDVETSESLWRGRFMQEFALSDAPEWTRWVEAREMALETALVQLLATEAEVLRQRGETDLAIARLEKAIGIDPYRQGLHSDLVDLHLDSGRLTKAAHAIGRAREMLGPETPAVTDMAERMARRLRLREVSDSRETRAAAAELRTELVGRTREMAILLDTWRKAAGGVPRVAVLTGPAGIGKTRLTEELAEVVRAEGATVIRLTAERNERHLAGGVIAELARKLAGLPGAEGVDPAAAATLRQLSPAIQVSSAPGTGELEPMAVAGSVTALLLSVAAQKPTLLVIDEAQWVDDSSRAVLSRLARSLDAARCALVVCLQDEETDRGGRDFIEALGHAEGAVHIRLESLSEGDVREMIALMVDLPEQNARVFRERLAKAAAGNPLYLTEVLRALIEEGTLVAGPEGLRLSGERMPDPLPLPSSIHELLHRRLATLSDPAIVFAAHLARMGGKAGLQEVQARSKLSDGALARAAGELLSSRVLEWSDPEIVSFTHERLRRAVLKEYPVGKNGKGRSRRQDRLVLAASLAAVVIAAAFLASWGLGRSAASSVAGGSAGGSAADIAAADRPPFGGGLLLVLPSDSILYEIDPRSGPPSEWNPRPPRFWYPRVTERAGPFRLASGDTVWYVRGYEPDAPPFVIEVREDGTRTEIVRMEGDVNLPSVSPDGRFITYVAQNPEADQYYHDLWVARTDGGEARKILKHAGKLIDPVWSPNGRYIMTAVAGAADTILAITPGGERAASVVVDRMTMPAWCGATDTLVSLVQRDQARSILTLDVGTGVADFRPAPDLIFTGVACSPDGSALVYDRAVDGRPRRVLHDLVEDRTHPLPVRSYPEIIHWLPEPGLAVPAGVRLKRDRATLAWGASETLAHEVVMSDSSVGDLPVQWTSSDSEVASVSTEGRVSANLPGRAWIRASLDGWLTDSTEIVVAKGRPAQLRFHETFSSVDPLRWYEVGYPRAQAAALEDGPALSLKGDGVYKDGVVSRESFNIAGGATLELSFRMSLTRDSQQRIGVTLVNGDPHPGRENNYPGGWSRGNVIGLNYPSTEDLRFDPSEISAGFGTGEQQSVFLRDVLPTHDWVHLALQVRPDGVTQIYVNRELVLTSRLRVDLDPEERYRIVLVGAAVDTELHVRNVSLWEGVRY
jgi:DNA-binding SARP family transcriptional activator/KaiC/GvpD/RAD55 family RecA-like ATPase